MNIKSLAIKHPAVSNYVKEIIIVEANGSAVVKENILPGLSWGIGHTISGSMEVDYGNGYEKAPQTGTRNVFDGNSKVKLSPDYKNIAVRLQPGALYSLLHVPAHELVSANFFDLLHVALGPLFRALAEQIHETGDYDKIATVAEAFFLKLSLKPSDNDVMWALQLIAQGETTISHLARIINISERKLHRLFAKYMGLSPQHFIKLSRFEAILKVLKSGKTDRLTHLALDHGYFDQAHFIHDVKNLSGYTPAKLGALLNADNTLTLYNY